MSKTRSTLAEDPMKKWYTSTEVAEQLQVHPHTIRVALVHGQIEGAVKEQDTNRWLIPYKWVKEHTPGEQCELLSVFLRRYGITRSSAIHGVRTGKIKFIEIRLPWTKDRARVYIDPQDPAVQAWLKECLQKKGKTLDFELKDDSAETAQEKEPKEKTPAAPKRQNKKRIPVIVAQEEDSEDIDDMTEEMPKETDENTSPVSEEAAPIFSEANSVNEDETDSRYNRLLQKWTALSKEEQDHYIEYWGLPLTYHSCKLDKNDVTGADVATYWQNQGIIRPTKTLLEAVVAGACNAYTYYKKALKKKLPLTITLIKKMHLLMTTGTYDENRLALGERPGEFKSAFHVLDPDDAGAESEDVEPELTQLLEELKNVKDKEALTAGAYFLATFENIHPFADGNGRVGRLLMNYFLVLHKHPPIIIRESERERYFEALAAWDKNEDITPLKLFLKEEGELSWSRLDHDSIRARRAKVRQTRLQDLLAKSD